MGSASTPRSNKMGNAGGTRLAARCEPQKRNAKREKNIVLPVDTYSFWKPNTEPTIDGDRNSKIPSIEIVEAENK